MCPFSFSCNFPALIPANFDVELKYSHKLTVALGYKVQFIDIPSLAVKDILPNNTTGRDCFEIKISKKYIFAGSPFAGLYSSNCKSEVTYRIYTFLNVYLFHLIPCQIHLTGIFC